ncbi:leucine-rich repeat protein, partial [Skeletonema marinoi]
MDHRAYSYYEANAADISFEDITSSKKNSRILRWIRDGDDKISHLTLGRDSCVQFSIGKGDNLGWLGYFIGRSVKIQSLDIWHLNPGGWEPQWEQQIDDFMFGLTRNQSIRCIRAFHVRGYESTALLRALGNLSLLEKLDYGHSYITLDGYSALGTLLESGVCKLKKIHLMSSNIDDDGVAAFANGLRSIGPFLRELLLPDNSIGNEGLSALVAALESCTSLERLNLSDNDFSLATAGLGSLSDLLQTAVLNLNELSLQYCAINDEGLQALTEGA